MDDAVIIRGVILCLVALSAWLWPRDMRRHWSEWTRRARRVTTAILTVLAANGYALIIAAQNQVPIRSSTWVLLGSFIILNAALLVRFANDHTTDRQYDRHFSALAYWLRHRSHP